MVKTVKDEIQIQKISDLSFWLNRMRNNLWHEAAYRLKEGAKEVTIKVEVT